MACPASCRKAYRKKTNNTINDDQQIRISVEEFLINFILLVSKMALLLVGESSPSEQTVCPSGWYTRRVRELPSFTLFPIVFE